MNTTVEHRRAQVLRLIIKLYALTGNPVSSRSLCSQYPMNLCSASVRNVMADLEEQGYITHLHTSAGRVPTDAGYRYFVDYLLEQQQLTQQEQIDINRELVEKQVLFEDIIHEASRVLSAFTNYAALISAPVMEACCFKHIQLVGIDDRKLCVTIVANTGYTRSQIVLLKQAAQKPWLERIQNFLNERLADVPLSQIRTVLNRLMIQERNSFFYVMKEAVELLDVAALVHSQSQIYLEGVSKVLGCVEMENTDAVRLLLRAVEEKKELIELCRVIAADAAEPDIRLFIGRENPVPELQDYALILAKYRVNNRSIGAFGVLGPRRMDYGRAIAAVDFVRGILNESLTRFLV